MLLLTYYYYYYYHAFLRFNTFYGFPSNAVPTRGNSSFKQNNNNNNNNWGPPIKSLALYEVRWTSCRSTHSTCGLRSFFIGSKGSYLRVGLSHQGSGPKHCLVDVTFGLKIGFSNSQNTSLSGATEKIMSHHRHFIFFNILCLHQSVSSLGFDILSLPIFCWSSFGLETSFKTLALA